MVLNRSGAAQWSIGVALFCTALFPVAASAGHELYSSDEAKLELNFTVVGAIFPMSNSWFG
ncbi:MAG: hypothetical protein ACRERV_08755, partial [Methylococcales bacterium]